MSNTLAIAAVTATIQGLISRSGVNVTAQSPDKVSQGAGGGNRLNVFLFHALPNAAWRNADAPGVRSGERGYPPLALNLYYLLTAYGTDADNGDLAAQQVLGAAMRVLHDRAELSRQDIRNFAQGQLPGADLDQQIESIRITHDPLSHEDLFRMWSTFSTPYRVSAAYQASVVLIDSLRAVNAALPVLKRGEDNRGVVTRLDSDPALDRIEYRESSDIPRLPAARIGDRILVVGTDLPANGLTFVVRDPVREPSLDRQDGDVVARLSDSDIERISNTTLRITLQERQGIQWRSGMLSLELRFPAGEGAGGSNRQRTTNAVPLAVAPRLQFQRPLDDTTNEERVLFSVFRENGKKFLQLTTKESVAAIQRVFLILSEVTTVEGDQPRFHQIPGDRDGSPIAPRFEISNVEAGTYWVRLRVDGVDSLLVKRTTPAGNGQLPAKELELDTRFQIHLT